MITIGGLRPPLSQDRSIDRESKKDKQTHSKSTMVRNIVAPPAFFWLFSLAGRAKPESGGSHGKAGPEAIFSEASRKLLWVP